MTTVLQQCDHCTLIHQSDAWPSDPIEGTMFCPRCGHDESAFVDLESYQVFRLYVRILVANWSVEERSDLAFTARGALGPYDPSYIKKFDR